jgi:phosphinothricin acetyltransferase
VFVVGLVRLVGSAPVHVRLATLADADAIRAIYNKEVLESTVTFDLVARSRADQERWLDEHSGAYLAIVAEDADGAGADTGTSMATGAVVGFASLAPYRSRPAYSTTVEDSVYVRRDRQRRGVGRLLLSALVGLATDHGFHTVIARIVDGHEASIALHRAVGFEMVGIEREVGRKFGRWLDVAVMQRLL